MALDAVYYTVHAIRDEFENPNDTVTLVSVGLGEHYAFLHDIRPWEACEFRTKEDAKSALGDLIDSSFMFTKVHLIKHHPLLSDRVPKIMLYGNENDGVSSFTEKIPLIPL